MTTGLSLQQAAILVGRAEKAQQMYALGDVFGQLIYLLDALEDFAADMQNGAFNAIKTAYQIPDSTLPPECRQAVTRMIHTLEQAMRYSLSALDLPSDKTERFNLRLTRNVSRMAHQEVCRAHAACDAMQRTLPKMSLQKNGELPKNSAISLFLPLL